MNIKKIFFILIGGLVLLFTPCIPKTLTGYPCPACGTRRAVMAALKGNFLESVQINPYGILFLLLAICMVAGFFYDRFINKDFFRQFYIRKQQKLSNKYFLTFIVLCMLLNWMWNIHKAL